MKHDNTNSEKFYGAEQSLKNYLMEVLRDTTKQPQPNEDSPSTSNHQIRAIKDDVD